MNEDASERRLRQEAYWVEQLSYLDWHKRLEAYLRKEVFPVTQDRKIKKLRQSFYETVEAMLLADKIPFAENGPDFDEERKPIDTIVIHHTSEDPKIRISKLSAIGLVRQYAMEYLNGDTKGYDLSGQPIWSGHFKDGKMVFYAYHWLIRPDGEAAKLLEDNCIGWHSGNWDINTRSVSIALSGDYTNQEPSEEQITTIKQIIGDNYSDKEKILGHCQINPKTTCPGNKFLGPDGWLHQIAL